MDAPTMLEFLLLMDGGVGGGIGGADAGGGGADEPMPLLLLLPFSGRGGRMAIVGPMGVELPFIMVDSAGGRIPVASPR